MNISDNKYGSIENLIYEEGLRINSINFHQDLDLMLIVLNTGATLHHKISDHKLLKNASSEEINNFELIGKGIGVHWPAIDEDLSLKGFLRDELLQALKNRRGNAFA